MIFIKLILAHLLGDFVFQPAKWVQDKEKKKIRSPYLYLHVGIHVLLTFLLLWNLQLWWIPVIVGVTHFIIDAAKLEFQKKKNAQTWFFIDQFLHIAVLFLVVYSSDFSYILPYLESPEFLKTFTAFVFLTLPCSVIIKMLLKKWNPAFAEQNSIETDSLSNAGKYIGIIERILVFVFIVVGHWEGVGFMIAAKSVFRFSDLQEAKQRKLTEYVLIGTLLSFGFAIFTGLLWWI